MRTEISGPEVPGAEAAGKVGPPRLPALISVVRLVHPAAFKSRSIDCIPHLETCLEMSAAVAKPRQPGACLHAAA